jgi:hypothetical protein
MTAADPPTNFLCDGERWLTLGGVRQWVRVAGAPQFRTPEVGRHGANASRSSCFCDRLWRMTLNFILQITAQALSQLGSEPQAMPITGAVLSSGLALWQERNSQRFARQVEQELNAVQQTIVDRSFLQSDAFTELVLNLYASAAKTASEVKQQALAVALANTVAGGPATFSDKPVLLRALAGLTETEIVALTGLSEVIQNQAGTPVDEIVQSEERIAQCLGWTRPDVELAMAGLQQLGLVRGGIVLHTGGGPSWHLSAIARRLVAWCTRMPAPP